MTATEQDLAGIQRRVRADRHNRSFPLVVIGVLLVNYGVTEFAPEPVAWRYGAPLAFVIIWALAKLNETRIGVGVGTDYLVAAGFVFTATSLVMMRPFTEWIQSFSRAEGIWIIILGATLIGLAAAASDAVVAGAGALIVLVGLYVLTFGPHDESSVIPGGGIFRTQMTHDAVVGALGAILVLAGLASYRAEHRSI
ncbi:MAG TPA: hypothetical protein VKI19_11880 [Acidimicrobiales bacterium]|nr:hypothetical protein [Acidimicrobiales bacterium]